MGNLHKLSAHNKKKGGAPGGEIGPPVPAAPAGPAGPAAPPMQKGPAPPAPSAVSPMQKAPAAAPAAAPAGPPATENKAPSNPGELKMPTFDPPEGVKVVFDKIDRRWEYTPPSTDIGMKLTSGLNEANSFLKNAQNTGITKVGDAVTEAKNNVLARKDDILANLTGKVNDTISGGRHTRKHKHSGHKHSGHKHSGHHHGRKHKHSGHTHKHHHGRKHCNRHFL